MVEQGKQSTFQKENFGNFGDEFLMLEFMEELVTFGIVRHLKALNPN